jgi:hypothetical protein
LIDVRLEAPFFFRGGRRYPRYCTTYRLPYNTHCIRIDTVCIVRLRFIDVAVPVAVRAVGLGVWSVAVGGYAEHLRRRERRGCRTLIVITYCDIQLQLTTKHDKIPIYIRYSHVVSHMCACGLCWWHEYSIVQPQPAVRRTIHSAHSQRHKPRGGDPAHSVL